MRKRVLFISGINTDSGKTIFTGLFGKALKDSGFSVITQKLVQTGCSGFSDDILIHRKIMCEQLNAYDKKGLTCPYVFSYPSSPHLAAELEGKKIYLDVIRESTNEISQHFEIVLLEGAGGLHVPLNEETNLIDYVQQQNYPLILLCGSELGSINQTLMSLEIAKKRGLEVIALIYNHYRKSDEVIFNDTRKILKSKLRSYFPNAIICDLPIADEEIKEPLFGDLIKLLAYGGNNL